MGHPQIQGRVALEEKPKSTVRSDCATELAGFRDGSLHFGPQTARSFGRDDSLLWNKP